MQTIAYDQIPSPCFVLEAQKLLANAAILDQIQKEADVEIILALKGFAMWSAFPLLQNSLLTCTASSLHEALLCHTYFGEKAHTYAPAYRAEEFEQLLRLSSHISFNSIRQFERYGDQAQQAGVSCGLRVNPGYSDVESALYNPCAPDSRLGISLEEFPAKLPAPIEGLHFHALCESNSYALEKTLASFEKRFGHYLAQLKWINMGGGHLITASHYDRPHLLRVLKSFQNRYPHLRIILEPGAAVAWQAGFLRSTVLDIVERGGVRTAMLDVSFTAHMPDTLEMPYRPVILGAHANTDNYPAAHMYRLGGNSCLAGDYLEAYAFEEKLKVGDAVILEDMMHYTMVKTTTFNGVQHPSIAILHAEGALEVVRQFHFEDYKNRLS